MGIFDAFNQSTSSHNNMSPFGEAGLLGDPLHYLIGNKYDNFMRKTWEMPNKYIGQGITKFDKFDRKINPIHKAMDKTEIGGKIADMVHNKPGDSALAILGSIFGGGALMGGMGGGAAGGATSGTGGGVGFGATGSGFQGASSFAPGMSAGGGNAGLLASSGGISGGAGTAGGAAGGASQLGMQDYMKMGQQAMGQQGQQQQAAPVPTPAAKRDNSAFMNQLARQDRAQALRKKIHRTPEENIELRQLTQAGLLA